MKKLRFISFLLFTVFPIFAYAAPPLEDVWQALENSDRKLARTLLEAALKNPDTHTDAAMTLILLNELESKKGNLALMQGIFAAGPDPSPYLFPVWFDEAVMDGYSKKDKAHLEFIEKILRDSRVHESLKASARYLLGYHHTLKNDLDDARDTWKQVGGIQNWQLTGLFDNASGSGFDKNYEPVAHPEPDARFKSATNADVWWFTPKHQQAEPWKATGFHLPGKIGVAFAQSFVTSPDDREVVLAFGGSGSLKVWLNDQLIFRQEEERKTESDLYKMPVSLKKGVNRVLVQVGFTFETDYPNFMVRLLGPDGKPSAGLTTSTTYQPYPQVGGNASGKPVPHFAEEFFKQKIAAQPDNVIPYLLLARTYYRNEFINEAIAVLKKAQQFAPNNILVQMELLSQYLKLENRTEILRQVEGIRRLDEQLPFLAMYDHQQAMERENYPEATDYLTHLGLLTGTESEEYLGYKILLLAAKKEEVALLEHIEKAHEKYPDNVQFLIYTFRVTRNINPNPTVAIGMLEHYLRFNFNYSVFQTLLSEYTDKGDRLKAEKLLKKGMDMFPEEMSYCSKLVNLYYTQKNYNDALLYVNRNLNNAPFHANAWQDRAYIYDAMGKKGDAVADFEKAIHYNSNLFDARDKLRELQGKKPVRDYFDVGEPYKIISEHLKKQEKSDERFEYIFYDRSIAVFPEGSSVQYTQMSVKILNESGLQSWKETNLGYNEYRQRLITEKAEVIKKNGQKIAAEQNGSQIVFPSLEVGDAVYVSYTVENYAVGKLNNEYWGDFTFNDFVPVHSTRFRLLTPKALAINLHPQNLTNEPTQKIVDEFILYEWNYRLPKQCEDEDYMPSLDEAGMRIQLSTIESWKTIAEWYRDIALPMAKDDYNVGQAYDEIFQGKTFGSEREKAEAIYDYMLKNIRYSSVPFRQSGFVPQKPMTTLSTQLGDCKDLSLLYYLLAKKAGLTTHLVLVNTRDNGENGMQVPSTEFNHCIIKIDLPEGPVFQELTSEKLPFGALPNTVINSQALLIPNNADDPAGQDLIHLPEAAFFPNKVVRTTALKVENKDLSANTRLNVEGEGAADYRYYFFGLTEEKTKDEMNAHLGGHFKNPIKLKDYHFEKLDSREKDFAYEARFSIENEIIAIGGMKALKIPFFETIATLDKFPDEERIHPFLYWRYEPVDRYETELTVELPAGSELVELPENFSINNQYLEYTLKVEKTGTNSVKINRKVVPKRVNIPADQYHEFRETVKKIVTAEDKYVVFK